MLFDFILGIWSYFWQVLTSLLGFVDELLFGVIYEVFNYIPNIVSAFYTFTEAIVYVDILFPVYTIFLIMFFVSVTESLVLVIKTIITFKKAMLL